MNFIIESNRKNEKFIFVVSESYPQITKFKFKNCITFVYSNVITLEKLNLMLKWKK